MMSWRDSVYGYAATEEGLRSLTDVERMQRVRQRTMGGTCKVCDRIITSSDTSKEGLLAELCDNCFKLQNDVVNEILQGDLAPTIHELPQTDGGRKHV
jgi:hypothetical protein